MSNSEILRLPTAVDILQTQELIRTKEAELTIADTEYQEMKRKTETSAAKRDAIARQLLECKAYIARIRALPQEVLSLVFVFYTDDPTQSPWTLMQVTRAWRATALYTHAIWAKIMISSPAWQKSGASRRKSGREVCGSKNQLGMALRRAGNTPLDIVISLTNPRRGRYGRKYDRKGFHTMICHLASSRKCLQVHHLEIEGPCGGILNWASHWRTRLEFPKLLELPELRTFSLQASIDSQFLTSLWSTFGETRRLRLQLPDALNAVQDGFGRLLKSSKLVSLSLKATHLNTSNALSLEHLRSILDDNSSITTLELANFYISNLNVNHSAPSPLRLTNLQTLIMTEHSVPWPLEVPLLLSLTLTGGSYLRAGPTGSNNFSLLTSLIIDISNIHCYPPYFPENMHINQIHTLDICFGEFTDRFTTLMTYWAELSPVVFRLRKSAVSTTPLTEVIGSMERLEELQLEEITLKKEFFHFLAMSKTDHEPSLFPSSELAVQCPLLVRLQVDLSGHSVAQNKAMRLAAKRALNQRVMAGIAMGKWLIRFTEEKGWVDFLG